MSEWLVLTINSIYEIRIEQQLQFNVRITSYYITQTKISFQLNLKYSWTVN